MPNFITKILSAGEGKQLKRFQSYVPMISELEPDLQALDDAGLRQKTIEFRQRIVDGEELDELLIEAFAVVREAAVRTLGMRHFDVQLIGGMALHAGQIAEMKTGEGKTLVSTLAGYLNALAGRGVHIVTVNDYLAKRDSEWMGQIYRFLGMEVGLIQAGQRPEAKKPAYDADVTYGTNSEFGFDYLRDNMVGSLEAKSQRGHAYAIVDEVDSILIDEARTPLIISGIGTRAADTYNKFARAMPGLQKDVDYKIDEAKKTIFTTDSGLEKIERILGIEDIYADASGQLANHLQQALKAQFLFHKDVDYVVVEGEVKIVDEFTGRIMEGRRFSEGLHQALEAKEHVLVQEENQTLATITLQNYFRLYEKLAGMTGTALTEDAEFREIYKLPVMAIPPNKPVIRDDKNDVIYRTEEGKFRAVVEQIIANREQGQPSLVGTVSVEKSERLSRMLDKRGVPHEVLNAKHHEREAAIVAQAGRLGQVTIATNMAGRGTDILLGGNPEELAKHFLLDEGIELEEASEAERKAARAKADAIFVDEHEKVVEAGGLAVIGTERHEARRIDNQLRGRSGRQGDPGSSQFFLSLEDDLMRLFGGDRMKRVDGLMARIGSTDEEGNSADDVPIQAKMVSKAIESAQRQVEAIHFDSRKHVLEYDDVLNLQRKAIYGERDSILEGKDVHERAHQMVEDTVAKAIKRYSARTLDDWDWDGLTLWLQELTGIEGKDPHDFLPEFGDEADLELALNQYLQELLKDKEEALGEEILGQLERQIMLRIIDTRWMDHMQYMDYLQAGIGLRSYGQRDPLSEYKDEAYAAFEEMRDGMYDDYLRTLLRMQIAIQVEEPEPEPVVTNTSGPSEADITSGAGQLSAAAHEAANPDPVLQAAPTAKAKTVVKDKSDPFVGVGRNDPCPCGSGLKFKKCHGKNL
ncbi:MAG: preprotein translocase subunit SecA [Coriobacteriales bacterium]|jgi:preprotein translocase subunit SecA|nr:preprotein translocase subunit SecA [Coriobacteriales bacterium]